jgi:hypothetical protein
VLLMVDAAGVDGNGYTVEVIAGTGALDVSVDNKTITVTLAAGGSTATDIATAFNASHAAILTATATGTGADTLTLAEAVKNFTGGSSRLNTSANTATLVAAAINDGTAGLTATATGTGASSLSLAEDVKNFTGGGLNFALDNAKNTATLVASAIDALNEFVATASGTGATALTLEETKSFANGVDSEPDDDKNETTLVANAVNALAGGVTATATAAGALVATLPKSNLLGGFDVGDLDANKNGTGAIDDAINTAVGDVPITAVGSGDGNAVYSTPQEETDFTGGAYATISSEQGIIIIDGVWYVCDYPVDKWDTTGWKSGTPSLIT